MDERISHKSSSNDVTVNSCVVMFVMNDYDWLLQVMEAFQRAEKKKKPSPDLLFTDVFQEMTPPLEKQLKEMKEHVTKYSEHYPLGSHEPWQQ